jgi:endogenous inhibitor of DNA gyrase (YacG/DUF329 family)
VKRSGRCPGCGKAAAIDAANPWRPFCSERCKTLDLGDWFAGRYSIPADPMDELLDGDDLGERPPGQRHQ